MDTGTYNMENVRATELSDDELIKAYEYYEYWYKFMKSTRIKALDEQEIEWFNEIKKEYERRILKENGTNL